ncbi:MAG TPA: hypothetical protein VMU37_00625 [Caulobacteraceae bacterium]|nr:hypothetical protein [Caulobacteraceae bacterium]
MKTIRPLAFAVALVATPALADPGAWQIRDQTSPLDGSHQYEAVVQSDEQLTNILGQPERAALGVVCGRQGFELSVLWPDFVQKEDVEDLNVTVIWKADDGPLQRGAWIASTKGVGQLGNLGLGTLRAWSGAHKIVVRVPDQHGGQDATFQVAGIDQIFAHVSQTGCG